MQTKQTIQTHTNANNYYLSLKSEIVNANRK